MTKYNNRKTTIDNITFDSQAEADHYLYLRVLQAAGEIDNLEIHPRYVILDGFNHVEDGKMVRERPIYYEADFSFDEKATGKSVVVDVKGMETQTWLIKRKLFLRRYPELELRVVKS